MKKMKTRFKFLAFVLAVMMLLGTMPLSVIAEGLTPTVTITYKGKEVEEVSLIENDKLTLQAEASYMDGTPAWQWEILVNATTGTWVKIGDKTKDSCVVTYALLASVLDQNGNAQLRVTATLEEETYVSDPVTVKISYLVDNLINKNTAAEAAAPASEPEPAVLSAKQSAPVTQASNSAMTLFANESKAAPSLLAEGESAIYTIIIYSKFMNAKGDILGDVVSSRRAQSNTNGEIYAEFTVLPQAGYTPELQVQDPENYTLEYADGTYTLKLHYDAVSANGEIYILYRPNSGVSYTIYHYVQNATDDRYTLHSTDTTKTGTVGEPVPDDLDIEIEGYHALYYVPEAVAPDGQTAIHIYYDCQYYLVSFNLGQNGYGQDPIYVRNKTEIYLNTPRRDGFGFMMYAVRGYGVKEDGETLNTYDWTCTVNNNVVNFTYNTSNKDIMTQYGVGVTEVANGENRKKIVVTKDIYYEAIWSSTQTSFTVLYWKENASDGNYSLWGKQQISQYSNGAAVYSGNVVNATNYAVVPSEITAYTGATDADFFVLNAAKTAEGGDVVVQGNGSTTISVYYTRRMFSLQFRIPTTIAAGTTAAACPYEHTHGVGCIMATPNCTHVHTDDCASSGVCNKAHKHGVDCTLICDKQTHIHDKNCCDVHMHSPLCYGAASTTPTTPPDDAPKTPDQGSVWVVQSQGSGGCGGSSSIESAYVFVDGQWYLMSEAANNWLTSLCGGNNGDTGYENGDAIEPRFCAEGLVDSAHDHTYGCVYDSCTNPNPASGTTHEHVTCWGGNNGEEHIHTANCYSCATEEHVCNNYCNCAHVHSEDCYSPCILTHDCADHTSDAQQNPTVFTITAKYEQDISTIWPDYQMMQQLGWGKLNENTFYEWTFTMGNNVEHQYYKYPNMVKELCYTVDVVVTAQYTAEPKPYVVYFMFEDLDQSSTSTEPFAANGTARQQYNGKWYSSALEHFQGFFMTDSPAEKPILGMTYVTTDSSQPDMNLNGQVCDVYVFYYDRNTAGLNVQLYNYDVGTPVAVYAPSAATVNGVAATVDTDVKFGMPISEILSEDWLSGEILVAPDIYAHGYRFGGWYTSEYPAESTRVYSHTSLPDGALMLFAYWEPIEYTVTIYNTDPTADPNATLNTVLKVPYGSTVNFSNENFEHPTYSEVVGCFYHADTDGDNVPDTEKAFLFNNLPVRGDMVLYAKWSSRETVIYHLQYVYLDPGTQNEIQIAKDEEGYALAGQSKTFTAKSGAQLFPEYQTNYYPLARTASINLVGDGNEDTTEIITHTFYYTYDDSMEYYVHYLAEDGSSLPADVLEKAGIAEVVKHKDDSAHYIVVTENFVPLEKYLPDAYSKSLVLTATKDESQEYPYVNNHIYFYYTYNETEAYYKIVHQIQDLGNRETYTELPSLTSQIIGEIGKSTAPEMAQDNLVGFHLEKVEAHWFDSNDQLQKITLTPNANGEYTYTVTAKGTTIYFYYDRNEYAYTVKYTDSKTETQVLSPTITGTGVYEQEIIAPYVNLETQGWQVVGEAADRIIVLQDDTLAGELRSNSVIFKYDELTAKIDYTLVGEGGTISNPVDIVGAATGTGVLGSEAVLTDAENYRFVGWFVDSECTIPVTADNPAYALESTNGLVNNKITPRKYDTGKKDENGNSILLYQSAQYYAKFEPNNATLTITVQTANNGDANQRVLLNIVGKSGNAAKINLVVAVQMGKTVTISDIPVGDYTVSELSGDWTWRYADVGMQNVTVPVGGGSATIDLTMNVNQWLDGDSYGVYSNVVSNID